MMNRTAIATLLCVCGCAFAHAQPASTDAAPHALEPVGRLVDRTVTTDHADAQGVAARVAANASGAVEIDVGTSGAFGALRRGSYGARGVQPVIEMYDDLETLPITPPFGQSFPQWVNHPVDDDTPNFWQMQISNFAHVTDDPVGGNDTRKVRLFTFAAQPPDQFFAGWRVNLLRDTNGPAVNRLVLRSDPSQPLRAGHDAWNSDAASLWSSETLHTTAGFVSSRVLWGGTCDTPDCQWIGFPNGVIDRMYYLNPDPWFGGWNICTFMLTAPVGFNVGDEVPLVVQSWHRLTHQFDGYIFSFYIDYLDGQGEFLIAQFDLSSALAPFIDAVRGNASYEIQDASHYVDNVFAIGMENVPPEAPPLVCEDGTYTDDIEWLNPGPLKDQNARWFDALSSKANVDVVSGNKKIRQSNVFPDNYYREEFRTVTPQTFAFPDNPWRFCVDARVSDDNKTVRGVALRTTASSAIGNPNVTARLFIGHTNPNDPLYVDYQPRLYAQINPGFEPIINPTHPNPLAPTHFPQVGVDIVDIGPFASGGPDKTVCIAVDDSDTFSVTVDGVEYASGLATLHGNHAVARVSFESRNNDNGHGDQFRVDNVLLECATLPLVTYPAFSLVYLDDLSAYTPNVPVGVQADTDSPPNRWTSTVTAYIRTLDTLRGENNVLEMENIFRDTTPDVPGGPDFALFTQATTNLPHVAFAQDSRGWVAGGRYMLTDGATTRAWSAQMPSHLPDTFLFCTRVAHSSVSGTLWVQRPNPADDTGAAPPVIFPPVWFDTGRTLASLGVGFGEWFTLTIHMNVNGVFTYRVNNALLRDLADEVVFAEPLRSKNSSNDLVVHRDLTRLAHHGGDESSAPHGSSLYADDIRAWSLPCHGDANGDGVVDFADFSLVLANYGASGPGADAMGNVAPDTDGDGVPDDDVVNFTDFTEVLSNYGNECD